MYDDSKEQNQTPNYHQKLLESNIQRTSRCFGSLWRRVVSSRGTLGHVRSSQQGRHTEQRLLHDLLLGANSKVEYAQDRKKERKKKTLLKPICSWRCTVIHEPEGFSGTWNTLWGGRNMISATWSPHKTALKTQTWHLQTVHHNSYLSGLRGRDSVSHTNNDNWSNDINSVTI